MAKEKTREAGPIVRQINEVVAGHSVDFDLPSPLASKKELPIMVALLISSNEFNVEVEVRFEGFDSLSQALIEMLEQE